MTRSFFVSLGLCLLLVCQLSATAVAQTENDAGLWFAAFGNGKLDLSKELEADSPYRWWFDTHYRLFDDADGFGQSIIRPGLGIALTDEQVLWAGYAWIHTSPAGPAEIDEHRFWQQWTASPSRGEYRFLHRARFEQRWVETGDDVGLRWRQFARVQKLFSECSPWSVILWDEIFFNLNDTDWGADAGLDQNRAFIGIGYQGFPHSKIRTEIGYLNQYIYRNGGTDPVNHILSINFFF